MASGRTQTPLVDAYWDVLVLGSVVRTAADCGERRVFLERALSVIREADLAAERAGAAKDDVAAARFAVAAFFDEMVLNSTWPAREDWSSHPLQYELFGTQEAGLEFFQRLETVRRSTPSNPDLLALYYLCLTLGFEGQYTLSGREKLHTLIREMARELSIVRGAVPALSPHGQRPDELAKETKRDWMPWIVCGVSAVVVVLCFAVFSYQLGNLTGTVLDELTTTKQRVEQVAR